LRNRATDFVTLSVDRQYQEIRARVTALLMLADGKLHPIAVVTKFGMSGQPVCCWGHMWC